MPCFHRCRRGLHQLAVGALVLSLALLGQECAAQTVQLTLLPPVDDTLIVLITNDVAIFSFEGVIGTQTDFGAELEPLDFSSVDIIEVQDGAFVVETGANGILFGLAALPGQELPPGIDQPFFTIFFTTYSLPEDPLCLEVSGAKGASS